MGRLVQYGGDMHIKNIKIIFFNETKLNPPKESKSCTLVSGQLIALDSHGLGSSSEWI